MQLEKIAIHERDKLNSRVEEQSATIQALEKEEKANKWQIWTMTNQIRHPERIINPRTTKIT